MTTMTLPGSLPFPASSTLVRSRRKASVTIGDWSATLSIDIGEAGISASTGSPSVFSMSSGELIVVRMSSRAKATPTAPTRPSSSAAA